MSAIMISQVSVRNPELFQQYMTKTQQIAGRYGASMVTRGKFAGALANTPADHGLVVIVRFPSMQKLREWNESEDYRAIVDLRDQGSTQVVAAYEELA
jgi:uncharacterized protein (DUF1330 family)